MLNEEGMRTALGASTALHGVLIVLTVVGLPFLEPKPLPPEPQVMIVELAPIADKTNPAPKPEKTEAPKPVPAPPPKPEPPKPEPPKPEPPKPEPPKPEPPKPEPPKPEPPKPDPPKVEAPPPKPEPVPTPAPAPEKKAELPPPPKPAAKPAPPEPPKPAFDPNALQKLLDKRVKQSAPQTPPTEQRQNTPTPPVIASAGGSSEPLTISEIDLIRRQIEQCWNPPLGAKDAQDLIVRARVVLNPDGSLRQPPEISGGRSDPFWQAAAESVRRAILRCSPIKNLPPGKYERWRDIEFTFNPKDMVG